MRRLVFILVMVMGLWWAATLSSPTFETTALESRSSELQLDPVEPSRRIATQEDTASPDPGPEDTLEESPSEPLTDPRGFPVSNAPRPRAQKSPSRLALYRQDLRLESGGSSLGVLTLRALPAEQYRDTLGPAIEERQGFVYYQPLQPSSDPFSLRDGFPVFEKGSSGVLGFWTGVFHVRLTPQGQPGVLAKKYGLDLKSYDQELRWAALGSRDTADLPGLLAHLRAEPTVKETNLEIVFALKESR